MCRCLRQLSLVHGTMFLYAGRQEGRTLRQATNDNRDTTMLNTLKPKYHRGASNVICRWLLPLCCAVTVASTLFMVQAPQSALAASNMTTIRQDRRPDRERVINYGQGSTTTTSQSSSSTNHARPRLVRH